MTEQNSTADRLLESAGQIFTQKGYRDATIAEICEGAEANVAAVNYHFGDKRSLYDAVWHVALDASRTAHPLPDPELGDAEANFRDAIRALLGRVGETGRAGWMPKLQLREMAEPTDALPDIVRESIIPTRRTMMRIVARVLGDERSEQELGLCTMSLVSQILFLTCSLPVRQELVEQKQFQEVTPEVYTEHCITYNLSALRAMRVSQAEGSA